MTQAELEFINQKIANKEKMLREQAESLRVKQKELEKVRHEIEGQESIGLANRVNRIERTMDMLNTLTELIDSLSQQVANVRLPSSHGEPPRLHFEFSRENFGQEHSPIRLKDVIDSIPKYDGHKTSVFHFCKMCERTLNLISQYHEYHLIQLIINKLHGHAYAAVERSEYSTIFELIRHLRKIFGPNKSTDQYRGKFANIFMRNNENLLDYVEQVKEL